MKIFFLLCLTLGVHPHLLSDLLHLGCSADDTCSTSPPPPPSSKPSPYPTASTPDGGVGNEDRLLKDEDVPKGEEDEHFSARSDLKEAEEIEEEEKEQSLDMEANEESGEDVRKEASGVENCEDEVSQKNQTDEQKGNDFDSEKWWNPMIYVGFVVFIAIIGLIIKIQSQFKELNQIKEKHQDAIQKIDNLLGTDPEMSMKTELENLKKLLKDDVQVTGEEGEEREEKRETKCDNLQKATSLLLVSITLVILILNQFSSQIRNDKFVITVFNGLSSTGFASSSGAVFDLLNLVIKRSSWKHTRLAVMTAIGSVLFSLYWLSNPGNTGLQSWRWVDLDVEETTQVIEQIKIIVLGVIMTDVLDNDINGSKAAVLVSLALLSTNVAVSVFADSGPWFFDVPFHWTLFSFTVVSLIHSQFGASVYRKVFRRKASNTNQQSRSEDEATSPFIKENSPTPTVASPTRLASSEPAVVPAPSSSTNDPSTCDESDETPDS